MEKRGEFPNSLMLHTITVGVAAAAALLLLPALHRILMMLGWEAGTLVGDAVGAAVRALVDLIAALLHRHASMGTFLPMHAAFVFAALKRQPLARIATNTPLTAARTGISRIGRISIIPRRALPSRA